MTSLPHDLARDYTSAWVDDELDLMQVADLTEHLAGCADCTVYADALRGLRPLASALPLVPHSPQLAADTLRRIHAHRGTVRRRSWQLAPLVAAAVVIAVVSGIVLKPGTRIVPLASVPATAGVAELSALTTMYAEREIVLTPDGPLGSRRVITERTWWQAPDLLRVERDETGVDGGPTRSVRIRRGDLEQIDVDGRALRTASAPGVAGIPEPLSAGIAVLGHVVGPGPLVAGRATTRYELSAEGTRRVALVDTARFTVLGGEERAILSKEVVADGVVTESRTTRVLRVGEPIDPGLFELPRGGPPPTGDFVSRSAQDLAVYPRAAPRGLAVSGAGIEPGSRETVVFQRGAFQVLVTSYQPPVDGPAEVETARVAGRPAVLRIPLYGAPSVTFTPGTVTVTITAVLPRAALLQLAEQMYAPPE